MIQDLAIRNVNSTVVTILYNDDGSVKELGVIIRISKAQTKTKILAHYLRYQMDSKMISILILPGLLLLHLTFF